MAEENRRRSLINRFLQHIPRLDWPSHAADHYGQIKAQHKRQGTPIGELDTQIAAHALAEGLVLGTHNLRHFERVQGLQIEDWMQPAA